MAGCGKVAGHRRAHHAEPDESDGTHLPSLAAHEITNGHISASGNDGAVIDHLVYASNDLPGASEAITGLLGEPPTPGGSHVGKGTYNELLSLGGSAYLELIGPDPAQAAPEAPRPFGIDELTEPGLVAWCVRPQRPLAELVSAALNAGFEFGEVTTMSRRRLDGVLLQWDLTVPQIHGPFGCALPFMIDWGDSPHPTDTLVQAARLVELIVVHPDPGLLRAALGVMGVGSEVEVREGDRAAIRATIATGRGDVTLTS